MTDKYRILVRVPNWIGDAVLSTPAIAFLREIAADAHIAVMAKGCVKEVFASNPAVDEIIPLGNDYRETARILKQKKFDHGILFPNSFASAWLFFRSGIPERSGYSTDGRFLLLTDRIKRNPDFKKEHQVNYYLHIVERIGKFVPASVRTSFGDRLFWYVTDREKRQACDSLGKFSLHPGKDIIIGVNPGASFGPAKRWFPEKFAELADKLTEKYRAHIIIFGGVGDREIAEFVVKRMKSKPVNLAGMTNLRELAAMIAECNLFLTNDTGPMHIAAAVGTKILAVFGSTDPVRTGPVGNNHIIVRKETRCSPCLKPCCVHNNYECLTSICPDDILKLVPDNIS